MNTLEKFFKSIRTAPSARLKKYTTNELIRQLPEFEEHILYIVKNIYELLCSEDIFLRNSGAEILGVLKVFKYIGEFELRTSVSDQVYLQCREIIEGPAPETKKQKSTLVKKLKLDHIDARFLDTLVDGEGIRKKELKNAKEVEEKEIVSVEDFFEAINRNMFSSEWYIRHGALLGHIVIFSNNKISKIVNKTNVDNNKLNNRNCDSRKTSTNKIIIELNSNIFCKVYEILLNDKFNDFQDDRTAAPVREAAAELLKELFPYFNEDGVTGLFVEFLKNEDWQVQFSGMLVLLALKEDLITTQIRINNVLNNLVPFLNSEDEDIKYMAAELLDFLVIQTHVNKEIVQDIFKRCWAEVVDCNEIGYAKASILLLLKDICHNYDIKTLESCNPIHGCFTSSIEMVRRSAIELCEVLREEELLYLLGECILLDKTSNGKEEDCAIRAIFILRDWIDKLLSGINDEIEDIVENSKYVNIDKEKDIKSPIYNLNDFAKHFLRIISRDLHQPYDKNEFVCFEDTFFTSDGIRALGCNRILDNRLKLFEVLLRIPPIPETEINTMLAYSFNCIIQNTINNLYNNTIKNGNVNNISNNLNNISESSIANKFTINNYNTDNSNIIISYNSENNKSTIVFEPFSIQQLILNNINNDFKEISTLRKMPKGEFIKMIYDPSYSSPYPMCDVYAIEYFRLILLRNINIVTDATFYYCIEHNNAFLAIVTQLLFTKGIENSMLISCYNLLVDAMVKLNNSTEIINPIIINNKKNKTDKVNSSFTNPTIASKEIFNRRIYRNLVAMFEKVTDCLEKIGFYIMTDLHRMLFFEATLPNFRKNNGNINNEKNKNSNNLNTSNTQNILNEVFKIALSEKNTPVLKHYLSEMQYNELFIRYMLDNFDVQLFYNLVEYSHPVFHSLFIKKTITAFSDPKAGIVAKQLLASLIPALYFSTCETISNDLKVLIEEKKHEARMIVSPSEIPDYEISCLINVKLRSYQKEGIKWMAFLARFGLNGILADDMGLGKTIQVLSYVISEIQKIRNIKTLKEEDIKNKNIIDKHYIKKTNYNVLIICPSSLTTHWKEEAAKYFGEIVTVYNSKIQKLIDGITVATYDNLRRDTNILTGPWLFLIFDEGHLLKNRSTLLYLKAQAVIAEHKFILTGTPIHNSVDDMFSLFNLIMPGYLGTESEFSATYGLKITDKNVDIMEARLTKLSKKVLPFVMRRLKTEVLKDLPPKIIKDVLIDLSQGHAEIYKNVESNNSSEKVINEVQFDVFEKNDLPIEKQTISGYGVLNSSSFGYTRNLLKAASHPQHFCPLVPSSKTAALQDIFTISGEKKILIFFQHKQTIDFVIAELGIINYLRLDGSVPPSDRGRLVSSFINDPIQYLFLTTAIGGLGLNLVVAGVVVFYEHDWNPFNDLQAMDRAHRLGQRNTVNIFRLISRDTIEEKVMNYQNFKLHIASSIVTQQNTSVEKMDTKDLFERLES